MFVDVKKRISKEGFGNSICLYFRLLESYRNENKKPSHRYLWSLGKLVIYKKGHDDRHLKKWYKWNEPYRKWTFFTQVNSKLEELKNDGFLTSGDLKKIWRRIFKIVPPLTKKEKKFGNLTLNIKNLSREIESNLKLLKSLKNLPEK